MVEVQENIQERIEKAYKEIHELQATERKSNVMILFKDKEICSLKDQLQELEQQIKLNKSTYAKSNVQTALMHPLVNEEFENIRAEILDLNDKVSVLQMDNHFKKHGDNNPPSELNRLIKFLEKESSELSNEISESKIETLKTENEKHKTHIKELQTKLKENTALINHYEQDIDQVQDAVLDLQSKIKEAETELENLRKEESKSRRRN